MGKNEYDLTPKEEANHIMIRIFDKKSSEKSDRDSNFIIVK